MKVNHLLSLALIGCIATPALADDTALPAPDMSAYMAYRSPKPPLTERAQNTFSFLQGWYVSAGAGYSYFHLSGIENNSNNTGPQTLPNTIVPDLSESKGVPNIALGYQLRKAGFFSRMELSYVPITNIDYDARPFLNLPSDNAIDSDISSHLLLLKAYDDFNFDSPIIPYIQAGVGAAINKVSANSFFTVVIPDITTLVFTGSSNTTRTNLAADIGAGVRWQITPNFLLGAGYEFDYLGKNVNWDINYTDNFTPPDTANVKLKSGNLYANSLMASITWIPWAKYTDSSNYS